MKALLVIAAFYGLITLTAQVVKAECPMRAFNGRRNLQQTAPSPTTTLTGPDIYLTPALQYEFYAQSCPTFEQIVTNTVTGYVNDDSLTPAPLLRLFFHDCFVQGCDASLLLNSTVLNLAEKDQSKSSTLDKFYVIDDIKAQLEAVCPGVVSCADILAAVAVTSVAVSGGPVIDMAYGRRDALDSFANAAQTNMPGGFLHVQGLLESFANVGLNITDLVALSGGHTIGQTHCSNFADRFASTVNNPFADVNYGNALFSYCTDGGTTAFAAVDRKMNLDSYSATTFDNGYFQSLVNGRGVLTSDNDLIVNTQTAPLVQLYATDQNAFFSQFTESIKSMGRIGVLTGTQGQIRKQCWVRNSIDAVTSPFSDFDLAPISPLICKPASCPVAPSCAT